MILYYTHTQIWRLRIGVALSFCLTVACWTILIPATAKSLAEGSALSGLAIIANIFYVLNTAAQLFWAWRCHTILTK